jgi:hypothetical protein
MLWMAQSELLPDATDVARKEQVATTFTLALMAMLAFQATIG